MCSQKFLIDFFTFLCAGAFGKEIYCWKYFDCKHRVINQIAHKNPNNKIFKVISSRSIISVSTDLRCEKACLAQCMISLCVVEHESMY